MPFTISAGQDEGKVTADAETLLGKGWKPDEEEMGLQKTYYFKTYTKALVKYIYISEVYGSSS